MKRYRRRHFHPDASIGGDFWASYSDLIAGLLLIFIFVAVLKDIQLYQKVAEPAEQLRRWYVALGELCEDPELKRSGLAPDCQTGTIELPDKVFFDFNETALLPRGEASLRVAIPIIVRKLQRQPLIWSRVRIEVRGHADPVVRSNLDPYSVNLEKSTRRAESVLRFLTSGEGLEGFHQEIREKSLAAGAADMQPPGCDRSDLDCHEKMRRVEIHLTFDAEDIQRGFIDLLDQILGRRA